MGRSDTDPVIPNRRAAKQRVRWRPTTRRGIVGGFLVIAMAVAGTTGAIAANASSTPTPTSKPQAPANPEGVTPATTATLPVQHTGALQFTTSSRGWLVLEPGNLGLGTLLSTTNGGTTWSAVSTAPDDLWGVQFIGTDGWAVGQATLTRTTDGGSTWTPVSEPSSSLDRVDFVAATLGWGVTSHNALEVTTDGGVTWSPVSIPVAAESACFSSSALGWVVGTRTIYVTDDGGASWSLAYQLPDGATGGPLGNAIACTSSTAWVQFNLEAGVSTESYLEVRTTSGDEASSWQPVAGSGPALANYPQLVNLPQLGVSGLLGAPALSGSSSANIVGMCEVQCKTGGTSVLGVYAANAGSSFTPWSLAASTGTTIRPPVVTFASNGRGWMAVLVDSSGSYADEIYTTTDGGSNWSLLTKVPISALPTPTAAPPSPTASS
jgi:photosystem II stability/assembly factor-like uncharacterized protein